MTTSATEPTAERIAHALCPYCHPYDPADPTDAEPGADGEPVTWWCGHVAPVGEPAPADAPRCPDCARVGTACSTCGGRATLVGVLPPPALPAPGPIGPTVLATETPETPEADQ